MKTQYRPPASECKGFFGQYSVKLFSAASLLLYVLPVQPAFQNLDDVIYLLLRERPAFWDIVPFGQAASAAGPGCVLSDKGRMVPHRRLPAVIGGIGIGQPLRNKIPGMLEDCIQTLIPEIFRFFAGKPKPAAKFRTHQCGKKLIHITHNLFLNAIKKLARTWPNLTKTLNQVNFALLATWLWGKLSDEPVDSMAGR
jgi:hypothetical protein